MIRSDSDLELIYRFRYLTSKRRGSGIGYPGVAKDFDRRVPHELRFHFEKHDTIDGWSLGDASLYGFSKWESYKFRFDESLVDRAVSTPRAPMWWDQEDDPNLKLVEDRTLTPPGNRFYHPDFWEGVFPLSPQQRHENAVAERKRRHKEKMEALRAEREARMNFYVVRTVWPEPEPEPPVVVVHALDLTQDLSTMVSGQKYFFDVTSRNPLAARIIHDFHGSPICIRPGETVNHVPLSIGVAWYLSKGDLALSQCVG